MFPSVRELIDVEITRDGGSLAATYGDTFQHVVLFLKIRLVETEDGSLVTSGFEEPVVIGGNPVQWRRSVSWHETRQILAQMLELSGALDVRARRHLMEMSLIAEFDGVAPRRGSPGS